MWQYNVAAGPGARELQVVASFPRGTDEDLTVAERADNFVTRVEVEGPKGWATVRRVASSWTVPQCKKGCRLRYRYLLSDAASTWGDVALARRDDGAIESPPSTWLLRPRQASRDTKLRFHVTCAPGETFVSGVFALPGAPGTFEAVAGETMQLPYSAFGALRVHDLAEGGATLAILPGQIPEADTVAWAEAALSAVRGFYGRLPLSHVLILVRPTADDGVGFGTTMGYSGGSIAVNVGTKTTKEAFRRDWVLVHEMVHTALPDLPEEQHWLEEGLATYVEPLARARQGARTPTDVWGEWAKSMAQGEPGPGDDGLDQTHTWGSTYWGGALFCLAADVQIREQTRGKSSLEDALRAVLANGGNIAVSWPMKRVIEVGDRATGTHVLRDLYETMGAHRAAVDLEALWHRLGVVLADDGTVKFDDAAELAWLRKTMTPSSR